MVTLRKNNTNRVIVPTGDMDLVEGNQIVLSFTTPAGACYYVAASNVSTRLDFCFLEFTDTSNTSSVDPTNGVVNLPFEGEATLAIYRANSYTVDQSQLRLVSKERARLCH